MLLNKKNEIALLLSALLYIPTVLFGGTYPFPQNKTYNFGFQPTRGAGDNNTILTRWNSWKTAHVTSNGAGGNLRVQRDSSNGNDTVSEGISYGMLLAVYFDDQATFNGLWAYKQAHNDSNGLMNWDINSSGGIAGSGSATDADQDIAYALYLANYQWGSGGTYNYLSLANNEVAKVKQYDLDPTHVKPGDSFNSCRYPSYFFPNEYRIFSNQTNDPSTWGTVRTNCYSTIAAARDPSTGLLAEECTDTGQGGGCGVSSTQYQYNSCRVPFRMALDYVYYGDSNAQGELTKLTGFFATIPSPGSMGDCYNLSGSVCSSNNNAAFVGPAATAFMVSGGSNLQNWYNQLITMDNSSSYYNGALQLLTLLLITGNMPDIADPAAIYTPTVTPTPTPYAGTATMTPTSTPVPAGVLFEDFETGGSTGAYPYASTTPPASVSYSTVGTTANSGLFSEHLLVNIPTGGYGGWGCSSTYANAQGVVDATGAVKMRVFIKTDTNISFNISFHEGTVNGGDGENWNSPAQTLAASPNWQMVEVALSTFTLDPYSGNQTGNKTQNLTSVKQFQIGFTPPVSNANVYIDDIGFVLAVAHTPTPTVTTVVNPYDQLFDDFESPLSLNMAVTPVRAGNYADTANGASATWSIDSTTYQGGSRSGKLTYNTGTGSSYGCGGYLISPYSTPGLYVDASGAVWLGTWMQAPSGLRYQLEFQEAGNSATAVAGADGEAWLSPIQIFQGSGWQWIQIPVGNFTKDPYSGNTVNGKGVMDLQAISSVSLKLLGAQGSGVVYIDNVTFVTTAKTATPTITSSYTFSPTASPSPSPTFSTMPSFTNSPSSSPTGTPSHTPSSTISPSPSSTAFSSPTPSSTPSPSFSVSPTPSPTFTINFNSPTPTATPTLSPSNTPSFSASPSPTFTRSNTNSPSFTPTASASQSYTSTPTASFSFTISPTFTINFNSPTNTPTNSPLATFSSTPSNTALPSKTNTPLPSATNSPLPSTTNTPMPSASNTSLPSLTNTPMPSASASPSPLPSFTNSPASTAQPSPSPTASPNTSLPSLSVGSPASGASFVAPASITFKGTASSASGSISKVEIYNASNGQLIGQASLSGANWTFTWSNVAPGTYSYYVKVTDSNGLVNQSAVAQFSVVSGSSPSGSISILQSTAYPNPLGQGSQASLYLKLSAVPDQMDLRLYSASYRLLATSLGIKNAAFQLAGDSTPSTPHFATILPLSLKGFNGAELPSGTYYYVISAQVGSNTVKAIGKITVLR